MKVTIFAHNARVTAIAFPGEATNYNGTAVHTVEAEADEIKTAIKAVAPSGVGSPWPPVNAESVTPAPAAKPTRKPKE